MDKGVFDRVLGLEKDKNSSNSNTSFGFSGNFSGGRKTNKKIKHHKKTKKILNNFF
jgi:hypothetical protein